MAYVLEPTKEKMKEVEEWLKDRPQVIKDLHAKLSPFKLYDYKPSLEGDITLKVTIDSYNEDGTVSVSLPLNFNVGLIVRYLSDIDPDDLIECDLPTTEESKIIAYANKCISEMDISKLL